MKKYILDLANIGYLPNSREPKIIGDHLLVQLSLKEFAELKQVIEINEEKVFNIHQTGALTAGVLMANTAYAKAQGFWKLMRRQGYEGEGAIGGNNGTGWNKRADYPTDAFLNCTAFPDTDVLAGQHDTQMISIIKSPEIGIANKCKMVVCKIFGDDGSLYESSILQAIAFQRSNNVHFFGNSYFSGDTLALRTSFLNSRLADCIPLASAGNQITQSYTVFPACALGVIAVNAVDENYNAKYLNYLYNVGDHGIDISCNGVNCETVRDGVILTQNGSSCSTPFLQGLLLIEKGITVANKQNRSNEDVWQYSLKKGFKHANQAIVKIATF